MSMCWQINNLDYEHSCGVGKLLKTAVLPYFPHQPLPVFCRGIHDGKEAIFSVLRNFPMVVDFSWVVLVASTFFPPSFSVSKEKDTK